MPSSQTDLFAGLAQPDGPSRPDAEAATLREAFEAEMTRLYDAEDRRAEAG